MIKQDLKSLTKKERKEYARQLSQKEESSGKLKNNLTKVVIFVVAVLIIGGIVFVYTRSTGPKVEIGESITSQGANHISKDSSHAPYNSNPPTSGPHWSQPAQCKIYTEEVPDEAVLHSLEHGAVWVTYKDKNDRGLVKSLTSLIEKNPNKILLSPRNKNDSAIAVASWSRLLKLEEFEEQQISDFISTYKNNSPEPFAAC